MINAIIFLGKMHQLLIESLNKNAPGVFNIKLFSHIDFKSKLLELLNTDNEYTVFFKDRDVLFNSINESEIFSVMKDDNVFCFSLRLGENVTHCESLDVANVLHNHEAIDNIIKWDWSKHYLDFGYPLSLSGHIYRTMDIKKLIKNVTFHDEESLEIALQFFDNFPKEKMASYKNSVLVSVKDYYSKDGPSLNKLDFSEINSVRQDIKEMSEFQTEKNLNSIIEENITLKNKLSCNEIKNKIKVIIPFYNPGEFLEMCIGSIMSQKYENFEVIFIDDCSTDNSCDKIPIDNNKIKVIKNTERKTALENIHNAVMDYCETDDIVVILDGDDHLSNKKVLNFINDYYNNNACWVLFGQSLWSDGRRGFASAYTLEEFENIRKAPFKVSHIRTWRAGLFHKIKEQDENFSCMKDKNGNFYKSSYDTAIMLPLLELAGFDKVKFNDEILYVYNRNNPISDDKVDQNLQWAVHQEVSNKKRLNTIESYK